MIRLTVGLACALLMVTGCAAPDDPSRAELGSCLEARGKGGKTVLEDFRLVPCTTPQAAYKVIKKAGSCDDITNGYVLVGSRRSRSRLCLTLNAKQGDCFYQEIGFPTGKVSKVACGAAATYRVTKVADGAADASVCGDDVPNWTKTPDVLPRAIVYRTPPLTLCADRP
ncbi:hypothetical protein SAMN05444920_1011155 [Nonomuraea solani]|uniref:Lipoprotein n=1 Tax=Nonomuraea solani TaxID=1144553 RepID=A0A1H5WDK3_9ACTN|nr:hypothetical protein [Nonomuraea solani]SEF97669.1 hypothetical protein SAMN05444920_1011155 [Nonomuraea solani]